MRHETEMRHSSDTDCDKSYGVLPSKNNASKSIENKENSENLKVSQCHPHFYITAPYRYQLRLKQKNILYFITAPTEPNTELNDL